MEERWEGEKGSVAILSAMRMWREVVVVLYSFEKAIQWLALMLIMYMPSASEGCMGLGGGWCACRESSSGSVRPFVWG